MWGVCPYRASGLYLFHFQNTRQSGPTCRYIGTHLIKLRSEELPLNDQLKCDRKSTEVREVQSGNPLARVNQALEALGSLNGRPGNTPPSHGLMRYLRIWGGLRPGFTKDSAQRCHPVRRCNRRRNPFVGEVPPLNERGFLPRNNSSA